MLEKKKKEVIDLKSREIEATRSDKINAVTWLAIWCGGKCFRLLYNVSEYTELIANPLKSQYKNSWKPKI